ncbi:unnamed protein product [Ixodes pacificus]
MAAQKAAAAAAASSRLRFSAQDDISLLQEVHALNPFEDPSRWAQIVNNLLSATVKSFSARAVRDRLDLLIAQFAAEDRANLRRRLLLCRMSGTKEQYSEKEHLLQEIADLTREFNYKYKAAAVRRAAPSRQKLTAAERSDASALRDTAAATNLAYSANGNATADACRASTSTDAVAAAYVATSSVVEVPESSGNIWTTCVVDTAEILSTAAAGDTYEIVAHDLSRELTAAATGTPSIDVGGHAPAASPEQTMEPEASRQVQRGKKKKENENLIFLEKRLQFEQAARERENNLEERRISLEEKRLVLEEKCLALDRDKYEQQVREWEE